MEGPHLWLKMKFRPAVKGAWGTTVVPFWNSLVPRNSPMAGRDTLPYGQGFRVRTEQGMGCV